MFGSLPKKKKQVIGAKQRQGERERGKKKPFKLFDLNHDERVSTAPRSSPIASARESKPETAKGIHTSPFFSHSFNVTRQ